MEATDNGFTSIPKMAKNGCFGSKNGIFSKFPPFKMSNSNWNQQVEGLRIRNGESPRRRNLQANFYWRGGVWKEDNKEDDLKKSRQP